MVVGLSEFNRLKITTGLLSIKVISIDFLRLGG